MSSQCPVCGWPELREPPRRPGGGGSYEICPSCGFEFGVSDEDRGISYGDWRERWRQAAMPWSSRGRRPPRNWNPTSQLATLPQAPPPPPPTPTAS